MALSIARGAKTHPVLVRFRASHWLRMIEFSRFFEPESLGYKPPRPGCRVTPRRKFEQRWHMFRKRQNRPLVSSVYFRFFRVTTILFRHNSRRPKTRRPRASWFIVASRTSRSRRARISVFQRCARTRRLSSPHVHRSSVERLARDLKHEKRPRLFVSCEGRVLRSVQDARSRSLVTTTDASSTTKLSQYARRRTAMSSMSGDGGGDQVAPASKPGIGRRRDGKAET